MGARYRTITSLLGWRYPGLVTHDFHGKMFDKAEIEDNFSSRRTCSAEVSGLECELRHRSDKQDEVRYAGRAFGSLVKVWYGSLDGRRARDPKKQS